MKLKGAHTEKPSPLGDRVYLKHRKMLAEIAKKRNLGKGAALRFAIESTHERIVEPKS